MLTREEQRRFNEIARRIDQDTATGPDTTAAIPVRRTMLGLLFMIGVTGVLTSLATNDLVIIVLAAIGVVTTVIAAVLFTFAGESGHASAPPIRPPDGRLEPGVSLLMRLWLWLTTCAENGCSNRPVHLGWCTEHAPGSAPKRDEYWGDLDGPECDRR